MSEKVLFISGRCQHSKKILIGIQQYEFMKPLFKIINIDSTPYPNYVKSVPTLLVNGQLITGETVFQYFGKLVEGKKEQEEREKQGDIQESDQGQCRINEEGQLEGWCGGGGSVEYSIITEESDDYTKRNYKINTDLSFLEGAEDSSLQYQIKDMEEKDQQVSEKKQQFDNDLERMQKDRGEIGNGMPRR
jgi:hypothetical protein